MIQNLTEKLAAPSSRKDLWPLIEAHTATCLKFSEENHGNFSLRSVQVGSCPAAPGLLAAT